MAGVKTYVGVDKDEPNVCLLVDLWLLRIFEEATRVVWEVLGVANLNTKAEIGVSRMEVGPDNEEIEGLILEASKRAEILK